MRIEYEYLGVWSWGEVVTWLMSPAGDVIAVIRGDNGLFFECGLRNLRSKPYPLPQPKD